MSKTIRTTNREIEPTSSIAYVTRIGDCKFEKLEMFPWVTVYSETNEDVEIIDEIDTDEACSITSLEDLEVIALNWYFNNVEIVRKEV